MVKTVEKNLRNSLSEISVKDYTLKNYKPAKASESIYQVIYTETNCKSPPLCHAQLGCSQLTYPFARPESKPFEAIISAAEVLVEANEEINLKRVLQLTIDIPADAKLDYQPGDTVAILPSNSQFEVQQFLNFLRIMPQANDVFQVQLSPTCNKKSNLPTHVPSKTTPFLLLRDCLNLRAVPKKQFLSALANCCSNVDERNFLNCLSSKEASCYYNNLILERGLTLIDLLQLCPSCEPPLALLIEHLPRLMPRPYSIANCPETHKHNQIKIVFSIRSAQPGVTTKMLNNLAEPLLNSTETIRTTMKENPKIVIYLRIANKFRYTLQNAHENNQILIGVGTALAPFFGFVERKKALLSSGASKTLGDTWLFAGAKTSSSLIYRSNFLILQSNGVLQRYFECFSRMPKCNQPRYVQEMLCANSADFVTFLLQPQTILYVCADGGQISESVESCVKDCLCKELQITQEEAQSMVKEFRTNGKYREDLWL